ncbi:uncharacterized protein LOC129946661 isoform X2 [Eupeodes corollae]|uniref:uncharacterized protein LOC129946661 isoform X2 n=1 Tax=Eupeodes corollae TaxID=290404 RepID=UPI002490386D|nr:uncharacterized protein LOC129946661 isoform X2 [Eupeodes corollae]
MKNETRNAKMIEVDDTLLKPSNLANSAVLRALEEEENEQQGGYKRVAWPPVSEGRTVREFTPQPVTQQQPSHQQYQQQPLQQQQSNYQRPGASPVPAANQGGHYQPSYPIQQEQQSSPLSSQQNNPQEPYYLQQRPSQAPAAGNASSTVSFRGGVASPVYNTPKPNPHQQQQYQQQPQYSPQSQPNPPQSYQQQQHHYQAPSTPEPQQYQAPADNNQQQGGHYQQQHLDEPNRGRWGHVASPVPQRTGYVQNYQPNTAAAAINRQLSQPPQSFESEQPTNFGSQQHQQNHYGASSVPQVNQSYDLQPSCGPPQQQQNNFAPAPYAPATAVPQQYYQAHQPPQPQQYSQTSQPIDNHYNYYSQPEPQQQYQQQQLQQQQYRGESPGIITLRKEAPITQQPAPVYTSQPAAASFRGGSNMRGDLKWPPPEYKEQAVVENEERRRIAQGPICRPRRINKDYTQFFAKNALSHHYPSYKTPPGTQHIYSSY